MDSDKCAHYARFASHLTPATFDIVYWLLFLFVVMMLFCASWYYGRSMEAIDKIPKWSPESPQYRHQMKKCLLVCGLCSSASVVAVVMETFALLALQFCDGEDLIMLYWATWTMLQVGSVIAILGVMLSVFHSLRGRKHPPWALALGTPVLVVAGVGHFFNTLVRKWVRRNKAKAADGDTGDGESPISQAPTLCTLDEEMVYNGRFLGYTPDGGPIIQFSDLPPPAGKDSTLISTGENGAVVVAFKKGMNAVVGLHNKTGLDTPPPSGTET